MSTSINTANIYGNLKQNIHVSFNARKNDAEKKQIQIPADKEVLPRKHDKTIDLYALLRKDLTAKLESQNKTGQEVLEHLRKNPDSIEAKNEFVEILLPTIIKKYKNYKPYGVRDRLDNINDAAEHLIRQLDKDDDIEGKADKIILSMDLRQIKTFVSLRAGAKTIVKNREEQREQKNCTITDVQNHDRITKRLSKGMSLEEIAEDMKMPLNSEEPGGQSITKIIQNAGKRGTKIDDFINNESENTKEHFMGTPNEQDADEQLAKKQILKKVTDLAKKLGTKQEWEIFKGHFIESKDRAEIAREMGFSREYARQLNDGLIDKIRAVLGEDINLDVLKPKKEVSPQEKDVINILKQHSRDDFLNSLKNHLKSPKLTSAEREVLEQIYIEGKKPKEIDRPRNSISMHQKTGLTKLLDCIKKDLQLEDLDIKTLQKIIKPDSNKNKAT